MWNWQMYWWFIDRWHLLVTGCTFSISPDFRPGKLCLKMEKCLVMPSWWESNPASIRLVPFMSHLPDYLLSAIWLDFHIRWHWSCFCLRLRVWWTAVWPFPLPSPPPPLSSLQLLAQPSDRSAPPTGAPVANTRWLLSTYWLWFLKIWTVHFLTSEKNLSVFRW